MHLSKNGFTLPELLISVVIIAIIFSFASINLLRIIPESELTEISSSFMADTKSQQQSAMIGKSSDTTQVSYSVLIGPNSYTLFRGSVYNPDDPTNYTVSYPDNVTASTTFPDGVISFSPITGDILGYDSLKNQIVFQGLYGRNLTILFNKIGNIYYVNRI